MSEKDLQNFLNILHVQNRFLADTYILEDPYISNKFVGFISWKVSQISPVELLTVRKHATVQFVQYLLCMETRQNRFSRAAFIASSAPRENLLFV